MLLYDIIIIIVIIRGEASRLWRPLVDQRLGLNYYIIIIIHGIMCIYIYIYIYTYMYICTWSIIMHSMGNNWKRGAGIPESLLCLAQDCPSRLKAPRGWAYFWIYLNLLNLVRDNLTNHLQPQQ